MSLPQERDVEPTAEPAEVRTAIAHLGVRERATLHRIHDVVDLRDGVGADVS